MVASRSLSRALSGYSHRSATIERGRRGDQTETNDRREAEAEAEYADQDRGGLTGDGEPAQADQRIEPQAASLETEAFRLGRQNGVQNMMVPRLGRDHSIFSSG